jgi:hypothetical protein
MAVTKTGTLKVKTTAQPGSETSPIRRLPILGLKRQKMAKNIAPPGPITGPGFCLQTGSFPGGDKSPKNRMRRI